jgi:hypothetical protein
MPRQNALERHLQKDASGLVQPVEVMNIIPTARQEKESRAKRTRSWEKKNRSHSYRIPVELHLPARDLSASLSGIASEFLTSASNVAEAFMAFSLSHLHSGRLTIRSKPNPERRSLSLEWKEVESGRPREVKPGTKKKKNEWLEARPVFLSYRWSADTSNQIQAIVQKTGVSGGEVVVFLLSHALQAYQAGHLIITPHSVVVTNTVTPSWGA